MDIDVQEEEAEGVVLCVCCCVEMGGACCCCWSTCPCWQTMVFNSVSTHTHACATGVHSGSSGSLGAGGTSSSRSDYEVPENIKTLHHLALQYVNQVRNLALFLPRI